jgi:hypothetical protein
MIAAAMLDAIRTTDQAGVSFGSSADYVRRDATQNAFRLSMNAPAQPPMCLPPSGGGQAVAWLTRSG